MLLVPRLLLTNAQIPLDFNEGWNALHAALLDGGSSLYPVSDGVITNNYPPASFFVLRGLSIYFSDAIAAGRVVSLVAMAVVAAGIYGMVRVLGAGTWPAVLASTFFTVFNVSVFRGYLAMNDPQWLGHAPMVLGLLVLMRDIRSGQPSFRGVAAAAVLVAAGLLVKHNIVAIPIVVTGWLLRHAPAKAALWGGIFAAAVAGFYVADAAVFHGNMTAGILDQPRQYSFSRMLVHALMALLFVPAGLAAAKWGFHSQDKRSEIIRDGFAISLVLAILQGSGSGVDVNAYFETLIFASVAVGIGVGLGPGVAASFRLAVFPLIALIPVGLYFTYRELDNLAPSLAETQIIRNRIAAIEGNIGCEMLAYCYWAGKGYHLDVFHVSQNALTKWSGPETEAKLDAARLDAIVLVKRDRQDRNPVFQYAKAHYHPVLETAGQVVYLRNRPGL